MKNRIIKDLAFIALVLLLSAVGVWVCVKIAPKVPQLTLPVAIFAYSALCKHFKRRLDAMTSAYKWKWYAWSIAVMVAGIIIGLNANQSDSVELAGFLTMMSPFLYAAYVLITAPEPPSTEASSEPNPPSDH